MRRILGIIVLALVMIVTASEANAKNAFAAKARDGKMGGVVMAKMNTQGHWGVDGTVTFNDKYGVRFGMMSDIHHPFGSGEKYSQSFEKVLGKGYRLSYTVGPAVKAVRWLWFGASFGYGEYGTYSHSTVLNKYGISDKVKGVEVGLQARVVFNKGLVLEVGYGTIPVGFSLNRPLHDISFGIGYCF